MPREPNEATKICHIPIFNSRYTHIKTPINYQLERILCMRCFFSSSLFFVCLVSLLPYVGVKKLFQIWLLGDTTHLVLWEQQVYFDSTIYLHLVLKATFVLCARSKHINRLGVYSCCLPSLAYSSTLFSSRCRKNSYICPINVFISFFSMHNPFDVCFHPLNILKILQSNCEKQHSTKERNEQKKTQRTENQKLFYFYQFS